MGSGEALARLIHSKNYPKPISGEFEWVRRKELFPVPNKPIDNTCGNAEGVSVDRIIELTEDDIWQRSCARVSGKVDRQAKGALVAKATELRDISLEGIEVEQFVYIYDDPKPDNPQHSVIRGNDLIPRSRHDDLRSRVSDAFNRLISGPSNVT